MATLRCNVCWKPLKLCIDPVFTTCGHIICDACRTSSPGGRNTCPACQTSCESIRIPPDTSKLPSSVRWCFETPDALLNKVAECIRFQRAHEQAYTHALRKQIRAIQDEADEISDLRSELERLKEEKQKADQEIERLKRELASNKQRRPTYLVDQSQSELLFKEGVQNITRRSPFTRHDVSDFRFHATRSYSPIDTVGFLRTSKRIHTSPSPTREIARQREQDTNRRSVNALRHSLSERPKRSPGPPGDSGARFEALRKHSPE